MFTVSSIFSILISICSASVNFSILTMLVIGATVSTIIFSLDSEIPSFPASSDVITLNSYSPSPGILKPTHFAIIESSISIQI